MCNVFHRFRWKFSCWFVGWKLSTRPLWNQSFFWLQRAVFDTEDTRWVCKEPETTCRWVEDSNYLVKERVSRHWRVMANSDFYPHQNQPEVLRNLLQPVQSAIESSILLLESLEGIFTFSDKLVIFAKDTCSTCDLTPVGTMPWHSV